MSETAVYATFTSWGEVLAHVASGARTYYHAPMDWRPAFVRTRTWRDRTVLVAPLAPDADPFVADEGHVGRFRRLAGS